MNDTFSAEYSDFYDLLYDDKDYVTEGQYVARLLKDSLPSCASIVEFGSGTGRHARILEKEGFSVTGVERSESMIAKAQASSTTSITYRLGDMRNVDLEKKYDAAVALFHVVSYLSSNQDVLAAFRNVRSLLPVGGLFLFDFWYGPAVLSLRPESRIKEVQKDGIEITRFAETKLYFNENIAEVSYKLHATKLSMSYVARIREVHTMRYFFMPELEFVLDQAGFRIEQAHEWLTGSCLDDKTWNGCILARAL